MLSVVVASTPLSHAIESLCSAAKPDLLPSDFGNVSGIADNDCCHYFVAMQPATIADLAVVQETGKLTFATKNTKVIPSVVAQSLGSKAVIGDIDYWDGAIYTPVNNGTHGAIVTINSDLSPKGTSIIVDEPLVWAATDYAYEVVYAGSAGTAGAMPKLFVFDANNLQYKSSVAIQGPGFQTGANGAALNVPGSIYLTSSAGEMKVVNATTGQVTDVNSTVVSQQKSVVGLANIWEYGSFGSFHFAVEFPNQWQNGSVTQIEHFQDCGLQQKQEVVISV